MGSALGTLLLREHVDNICDVIRSRIFTRESAIGTYGTYVCYDVSRFGYTYTRDMERFLRIGVVKGTVH